MENRFSYEWTRNFVDIWFNLKLLGLTNWEKTLEKKYIFLKVIKYNESFWH